jgi:hypothetical protein
VVELHSGRVGGLRVDKGLIPATLLEDIVLNCMIIGGIKGRQKGNYTSAATTTMN